MIKELSRSYNGIDRMDIQEATERILKACTDLDAYDYLETTAQDYEDIEEALYQLLAIVQNEYNSRFYTTFYNALKIIFND